MALLSLSNTFIAAAFYDGQIQIFSPFSFKHQKTLRGYDSVLSSMIEQQKMIILVTIDLTIFLWDINKSYALVRKFDNWAKASLLAPSPFKNCFASGAADIYYYSCFQIFHMK